MKSSRPGTNRQLISPGTGHGIHKAYTPDYKTSVLRDRRPARSDRLSQFTLSETTGPAFGHDMIGPLDNDLTLNFAQPGMSAIGERVIVQGRVIDERGQPVPNVLIEFWQANAGGRYRHKKDGYLAPLDPNFGGCGRTDFRLTMVPSLSAPSVPAPTLGRMVRMTGVRRTSTSRSSAMAFAQRLITQMYFEGDPLIPRCPIVQHHQRSRGHRSCSPPGSTWMRAAPMDSLAYRFDIVLRGSRSTLFENRLGGKLTWPTPINPHRFTRFKESPSQTAGPYVHIGLTPNFCGIPGCLRPPILASPWSTTRPRVSGSPLEGSVIDGAGNPLKDALVEIWQADADGIYKTRAEPGFSGWGRAPADGETGIFRFETIKPGRVAFPDGRLQAPHINVWIVARGINLGLNTRIYFEDEAEANAGDPVLARIEHRDRVPTLIAKGSNGKYSHDIHLQGAQETVFFDI
jgi:protocatechuate 3,4-dioxygenase alpha subunit